VTEEKKKHGAEFSVKNKIYILIVLIAIVLLVIALYRYFDNQAVLRECEEIEREILMNPELQELNTTCTCHPGHLYIDKLNLSEELKERATLRYVVFCESGNQTRVYPIWKSK
jgi:hypothetical protein